MRMTTHRLVLVPPTGAETTEFRAMNADPRVMAHFASPLDSAESDDLLARFRDSWGAYGIGPWSVFHEGRYAGFAGLLPMRKRLPLSAPFDLVYRFQVAHHGAGLAAEAARAALVHAFARHWCDEVVAFTAHSNDKSLALMARLGFQRLPEMDFDHPDLPPGHALRPHKVARISRECVIGGPRP
ncbi:GNAT family N-acetyltransferase [Yunchengibacter salinarum]|uniref:GNAT family N-acetyltransferase n=1 Tax=Yunchengibacter salinarum TaxID=3133399 RepID=UPI0035B68D1A